VDDEHPSAELTITSDAASAPYQPGRFYLRELPDIRGVLALLDPIDLLIVDGYVWLGADKGLGAHLHDALDGKVAVIGVAKTHYAGATATEVIRGGSARPLYITAAGIDEATAAAHVAAMHGEHRIPTLLRRVDQLARGISG
jgi:deoxyribonuclease V